MLDSEEETKIELTVQDIWVLFKEVLEESMFDRSKAIAKVFILFNLELTIFFFLEH